MDYLDRVFFILDSSGATFHEQLSTETLWETEKKKHFFFVFKTNNPIRKNIWATHRAIYQIARAMVAIVVPLIINTKPLNSTKFQDVFPIFNFSRTLSCFQDKINTIIFSPLFAACLLSKIFWLMRGQKQGSLEDGENTWLGEMSQTGNDISVSPICDITKGIKCLSNNINWCTSNMSKW